MFKKISIAAALAMAIGGVGSNAVAGTSTANLAVSATVNTKCSATTTAVAFGAYDPTSASATNAVGQVIVTCTKAATGVTVELGQGSYYSAARRMRGATVLTDFITYELYKPLVNTPGTGNCGTGNGVGTVWGSSGANLFTPDVSGSPWAANSAKTFEVCGVIAPAQDVTAGGENYADTVVATLNF